MLRLVKAKELSSRLKSRYELDTLKAKPGPGPEPLQDTTVQKIVQYPFNIERRRLLGMPMDLSLASGSLTSSQSLTLPEPEASLPKSKPRKKPRAKDLNTIVEVETNKPKTPPANVKVTGIPMDLSVASASFTSSQSQLGPDPDPEPKVSSSNSRPRKRPCPKNVNNIDEASKPNGRTAHVEATEGMAMEISVSAPSHFLASSQSPPHPDPEPNLAIPKSRPRKRPNVNNATASAEANKPKPNALTAKPEVAAGMRMAISAASESLASSHSSPPDPDLDAKASVPKSRSRKKPLVKNLNFIVEAITPLNKNAVIPSPMEISAVSDSLTSSQSPPGMEPTVSLSKPKPKRKSRAKNPNSNVVANKQNVRTAKSEVASGLPMEISETSPGWSGCLTPSPSDQDLEPKGTLTKSKSKPRNKPRGKNLTTIVEANKPNGRTVNMEFTAVTPSMPMDLSSASNSPTSSQPHTDPEPKVSSSKSKPRKKPTVRNVNANTFGEANKQIAVTANVEILAGLAMDISEGSDSRTSSQPSPDQDSDAIVSSSKSKPRKKSIVKNVNAFVEANKLKACAVKVQDIGEKIGARTRIINLKIAQVAGGKKAMIGPLPLPAAAPVPAPAPIPIPAPKAAPAPIPIPLPLPCPSLAPIPVPRVPSTKILEPHRFAVPKIPLFNRVSRGASAAEKTPVQVQGSSKAPDPTETVTETETDIIRATLTNVPPLPPSVPPSRRISSGISSTNIATVTKPVPVFEYDAFFPPFPNVNILHPKDTPEDNLAYILNGVELNKTDGLFFNDRDAILNILKKQFVDNIGEGQSKDQGQGQSHSGDGPGQEVPQLGDDLTSSSPDEAGDEWPYWISKDIWLGVAHYAFPSVDLHYHY